MKIQLLSDLHLDYNFANRVGTAQRAKDQGHQFYEMTGEEFIDYLDPSGVDVLVLAGDIDGFDVPGDVIATLGAFGRKYKDAQVLYVPGNHEYWGSTPESTNNAIEVGLHHLRADGVKNVHWLRPGHHFDVGKQRFVGATLWYPKVTNVALNIQMRDSGRRFPDFINIYGLAPWVYEENERAVDWFWKTVTEHTVVITHHLPSDLSTPAMFKGSLWNHFFVCDQTDLIEKRKPKLWLHGHTHDAFDYVLHDTRVVCNPFGNPHEWGKNGFVEKKLIEV